MLAQLDKASIRTQMNPAPESPLTHSLAVLLRNEISTSQERSPEFTGSSATDSN